MTKARTVAIIGAGSSGQAVAGFLALSGYQVTIWNRDDEAEVSRWLTPISERDGALEVRGVVEGTAQIKAVTTDLEAAITGADVIIVNTTTDAYQSIGMQLAPYISSSQALILMAAGTLGAIDMWQGLASGGFTDDLLVGETSTTVFGSRANAPATVQIAGKKDAVEIASLPSGRAHEFTALLPELSLVAAGDVLMSGFNNSGPALHVAPMVLNSGWVEAEGGQWLYYFEGVTPSIAAVIEQFDQERLAIARAFGYEATSLSDYLTQSVGAPAGSLWESIHGTPMYAKMPSPESLDHRFLWEDALAGAVPLLSLAQIAGVQVPIFEALVTMSGALLGRDVLAQGRTARSLSLDGFDATALKELVRDESAFAAWKLKASSAAVRA